MPAVPATAAVSPTTLANLGAILVNIAGVMDLPRFFNVPTSLPAFGPRCFLTISKLPTLSATVSIHFLNVPNAPSPAASLATLSLASFTISAAVSLTDVTARPTVELATYLLASYARFNPLANGFISL